jgi:enterochelin esterase-like enzyme
MGCHCGNARSTMTAMLRTAGFLLLVSGLAAQQASPPMVSPEVLPDRRVTFRLAAPSAAQVQLSGDWMGTQPPAALTKGADGTWAVTVGPLEPNIYSYRFLVDGVAAPDPVCRCTFATAGRFVSSKFTISGTLREPWLEQPGAAKGSLHTHSYFAKRQHRNRSFVVYTPPAYDPGKPIPVLLLLPGTPGDEHDWTLGGGFAHHIFDNLIASGAMRPMLVVMHSAESLPSGTRAAHLKEFEPLIVDELIPAMKQRYRTPKSPKDWAIAGLSLGGDFAVTVGLRHPDLFRTVASISGSMVERDFDDRFGAILAKPERAKEYHTIWIGCGDADIFAAGNKALVARFETAGIKVVYRTFDGAHQMPVFRRELAELLPLLFR